MTANFNRELQHNFTIGSDPEIFVEDDKSVVIPAFDFLGPKSAPTVRTVRSSNVYWDGFQAEFDTSAGGCLDGQIASCREALMSLLAAARLKNKTARLSARTVMNIPADMLEKAKDEHVQFGCSPSLNAYGLKGTVVDGRQVAFRPAGGHIHFGLGTTTEEKAVPMVKALDAIAGVACVSMFANFDDPRRRSLYGLPGEYRLPNHGLEYRTLSNAWLFHPLIAHMTIDLARKALMFGSRGFQFMWKADEKETIEVIQNCDVKGARAILERNKELMIRILKAIRQGYDVHSEVAYKGWLNGMESIVVDPTAVERNWGIDTGRSIGRVARFYDTCGHLATGKKVA